MPDTDPAIPVLPEDPPALAPGQITGRYRAFSGRVLRREPLPHAPIWWHVLERFGFPTLVAIALGLFVLRLFNVAREDRATYDAAIHTRDIEFARALQRNTDAIEDLGRAVRELPRKSR